jgi:hypothetical protein
MVLKILCMENIILLKQKLLFLEKIKGNLLGIKTPPGLMDRHIGITVLNLMRILKKKFVIFLIENVFFVIKMKKTINNV